MRRHRPTVALYLRMWAAVLLTPAIVLAGIVLCIAFLPLKADIGLGVVLLVGLVSAQRERAKLSHVTLATVAEAPELHGMVERLCVVADVAKPHVVIDHQAQPNSWVVDLPGRTPDLHVTTGLLELLTPSELEAVVAHELAHLAHHDASLQTVVSLPAAAMRSGSGHLSGAYGIFGLGILVAWLIGSVAGISANVLSRTREIAADAGAARFTGHPAALASALLKVSGEIGRLPAKDLRDAAPLDVLHLLPVAAKAPKGRLAKLGRRRPFRLLAATHPSLDARLAALERLEGESRRLSYHD